MKLSDVRKFYIRHRENYPESELMSHAREGFHQLGIDTAPFYWIDDINDLKDLGPEVGVCGYIGDVMRALDVLGVPRPIPIDYPEELTSFLGRNVWKATLGEVRASVSPIFVKPIEQKRFTGFLWTGDWHSRRRVVVEDDDLEVWASDPVQMVSEYRCIVLDREILDVRLYKGDWSKAPSREVVEAAVKAYTKGPVVHTLDFAVTQEGATVLVEANDGFAFGHYGLRPPEYANCLAVRWEAFAAGV